MPHSPPPLPTPCLPLPDRTSSPHSILLYFTPLRLFARCLRALRYKTHATRTCADLHTLPHTPHHRLLPYTTCCDITRRHAHLFACHAATRATLHWRHLPPHARLHTPFPHSSHLRARAPHRCTAAPYRLHLHRTPFHWHASARAFLPVLRTALPRFFWTVWFAPLHRGRNAELRTPLSHHLPAWHHCRILSSSTVRDLCCHHTRTHDTTYTTPHTHTHAHTPRTRYTHRTHTHILPPHTTQPGLYPTPLHTPHHARTPRATTRLCRTDTCAAHHYAAVWFAACRYS